MSKNETAKRYILFVISLFFDFSIVGTREGTILSALLTGVVVKFFCGKLTEPLNALLCQESTVS